VNRRTRSGGGLVGRDLDVLIDAEREVGGRRVDANADAVDDDAKRNPRLAGVDRDPRATFPLAAILRHVVRTTEALLVGERGGERFGIFFVIIRSPVCARRDFGAPGDPHSAVAGLQ